MKKLILTGKMIALLQKVSKNTAGFYPSFEQSLTENGGLSETESVEIEVSAADVDDIIDMINDYLQNEDLSGDDVPTEEEKTALQELVAYLEAIEWSDDEEEEVEESEEADTEEEELEEADDEEDTEEDLEDEDDAEGKKEE